MDAGTITIYSVTPFERTIYWYGTCNESDLDKDKKFISKNITDSGRFYRRYKGIDNTELRGSDIKLKYNLWVNVFGK